MKDMRVDHLGNEFDSTKLMCKHWGVPMSIFISRVRHGHSTESALTTSTLRTVAVVDHLGNEFRTNKEMCKHWKIDQNVFYSRVYILYWSIERALTVAVQPREILDHLGNKYGSFTEMCVHYNKSTQTVWSRVYLYNWELGHALTVPVDSRKGSGKVVTDHTGKTYTTIKEMCLSYGISTSTYLGRINSKTRKWTLEELLTTQIQRSNGA